jgi:hypothetical protein
MKETRIYEFKQKGLIFNAIFTFAQVLLIIWVIYKLFWYPFIWPFVILLPAIFLRFQVYEMYMIRQFTRYDAGKKIVVHESRELLTLTQRGTTATISNADVERIECYDQKYLSKFGKYDYMVIYTTDQREILLTDFTVPLLANDSIMMKFLRKKPRTYFEKRFNYIDEAKFKPYLTITSAPPLGG